MRDRCVIEPREQKAIDLLHVGVERLDRIAQRRIGEQGLQLFMLRIGGAVTDVDLLKAGRNEKVLERVGCMARTCVMSRM